MSVYSFSQIQTYLQCPLSYKFKYIDDIKPDFEKNLHLILWTTVHSSLEYLYTKINNFYIPKFEEIENYFLKDFKEQALKLENINLDDKKKEFEIRWIEYLKSYYKRYYPFENIKVVWTEIQIYIDLWDNIKFQWFIDRLDKKQDSFIITDYKTNQNLPSSDKDYYIEQLSLYALWIKQKYWRYFNKIYWNLEYLHFETFDFWEIKDEDIQKIVEKYKNIVLQIETKKAEHWLWIEDIFKPFETSLCKFCNYKEICPLFAHFYGNVSDEDFSEKAIKNMIDEYINLNEQKKEIEYKMTINKEILVKFAQTHNLKKLYWECWHISLSNLFNYIVKNKEKLKEYLKDINKLEKFVDIDRYKIEKAIKENDLNFKDLQDMIDKNEIFVFRTNKK